MPEIEHSVSGARLRYLLDIEAERPEMVAEIEQLRTAIYAAVPHIERALSYRSSAAAMRILTEAINAS